MDSLVNKRFVTEVSLVVAQHHVLQIQYNIHIYSNWERQSLKMQLQKFGVQFSIWTGNTAQLIHRLAFLILEPDGDQRHQQKHLEGTKFSKAFPGEIAGKWRYF